MKVVINRCFGGFSLSREAVLSAREISGDPKWGGCTIMGDIGEDGSVCDTDYGYIHGVKRDDPILVRVVEELGNKSGGMLARLKVVEIPDRIEYEIEDYDGMEHISEQHRTWG
jgi:hypothetical protein